MPKDPSLYDDAVHPSAMGVRVMGWVLFNKLAALIEKDILRGRIPKKDRHPMEKHPVLEQDFELLLTGCDMYDQAPLGKSVAFERTN